MPWSIAKLGIQQVSTRRSKYIYIYIYIWVIISRGVPDLTENFA